MNRGRVHGRIDGITIYAAEIDDPEFGQITQYTAIAAGVVVSANTPEDAFNTARLPVARSAAIDTINKHAGVERSRYATNIPFQGSLYQLKGNEALVYQSDPTTPAAQLPILYAEAAARSMAVGDLAAEYLGNAAMLPQILAAIEGVRMGSITAIKNAATIEEIETALANVTWPEF